MTDSGPIENGGGGEAIFEAGLTDACVALSSILGWSGGNPTFPVLGQCLPRFKERYAGCFGDHGLDQRLCQLPEPF